MALKAFDHELVAALEERNELLAILVGIVFLDADGGIYVSKREDVDLRTVVPKIEKWITE